MFRVFQKAPIAFTLQTRAILILFEKPTCANNFQIELSHMITYANQAINLNNRFNRNKKKKIKILKRTSITATKQSVTSVHKSKIVFFTSIVAVEESDHYCIM